MTLRKAKKRKAVKPTFGYALVCGNGEIEQVFLTTMATNLERFYGKCGYQIIRVRITPA